MHSHQNEEITARLINWGLWNRGGYPNLGTPAFVDIMSEYFPQQTHIAPDSIDAEHLEYIISSIELGARNDHIGATCSIYPLVLKLEFIEHERPRELKAEHVRRKYNVRCSERTFRFHLFNAKKAVNLLANPLSLPPKCAIVSRCIID
jgi:hypothetical protein